MEYIIADIDVSDGLLSLFWSISELTVFMLCSELVPTGYFQATEYVNSFLAEMIKFYTSSLTLQQKRKLEGCIGFLKVFIGLSNIF
jgi:hypothetical protein